MDKTMKSSNRVRVVAVAALLMLVPATAFAQWKVIDNKQIDENKTNTNTLDKKLDKIREDHQVGKAEKEKSSGDEVDKPKEKLVKVDDNYGVSDCAAKTSGTPVSQEQQQTCELIQRTRNSQFNYMVAMYDITEKRLQRLRDLEQQRAKISTNQIGLLEDNTNKLIALRALMDIDRQQTEAAMFAYEKRLSYLTQVQSAGAWAAMRGKKAPSATDTGSSGSLFDGFSGLSDFASKIAAGAAMGVALEAVKSSRPQNLERLSIAK
ncbi:hypothetical protein [Xanthomonas sp. NCPPB 1128]|uniref:hypothetical protein n=1 Tax=Xanthomonas sp. NCPPB 1128 TaxID=1775876 RepID=UPI000B02DD0C|nr:hypothetical protein [Xanthomonas sp. NCPPB 1128]